MKMRSQRKLYVLAAFSLLVIIKCLHLRYLIYNNPRFAPITLLRLFETPIRERRNECPEGIRIDHSSAVSRLPVYVFHQHQGGRLGNIMFQTAALVGIAHTLNHTPFINESESLPQYFEMTPTKPMLRINSVVLSEDDCRHTVWRCRKELYSHNVTIQGTLQSWRYFHNIAPIIRQLFTIKQYYRDQAKRFIDAKIVKSSVLIGLHVRRTDTLELHDTISGYTAAKPSYIAKAMAWYRERYESITYLVISDDKQWCKETIIADNLVFSDFEEPVVDMALMSMCDHMIMTIGTFGWWGAWLAGGQVVYLKDWPERGSWLDLYGVVKEDFFPPHWVGLSN